MKKSILIIFAMFCFGKSYCQASINPATDLKKLEWLQGTWIRTNAKPGQSGNETWLRVSASELQGSAFTLKGQDTLFTEKLKLVVKGNNIYYVADVSENKGPVDFKFTGISENGFTCENPEHDFPKKISYQKEGNKLKATISGNGRSVDYLFEKK